MQTTNLKALYEHDFAAWAEEIAQLLEQQFDRLDLPNLIKEIWDLSKRERERLLISPEYWRPNFLPSLGSMLSTIKLV